jgi:hypothetical protein
MFLRNIDSHKMNPAPNPEDDILQLDYSRHVIVWIGDRSWWADLGAGKL